MSYQRLYVFVMLVFCKQEVYETLSLDSALEGRIVKGYKVGIDRYPHAVFLHLANSVPKACGGSLITVNVIITAADCLEELRYRNGTITALFGSAVPIHSDITRPISNYRIHPQFNPNKGKFNLGLAYFRKRVPLGHLIQKIPIAVHPPSREDFLITCGWGKQVKERSVRLVQFKFGEDLMNIFGDGARNSSMYKSKWLAIRPGKFPDYSQMRHLKASKQIVVSNRVCERLSDFEMTTSSYWCTESFNGYHYHGDLGNGLMTEESFLVGVVSHIINDVTVYSDVIHQNYWITTSLRELAKEHCKKLKNSPKKSPN